MTQHESGQSPEHSRDEQIQQLLNTSRFLVFRPDMTDRKISSDQDFELAEYAQDGARWLFVAEKPDEDNAENSNVEIQITGKPRKNDAGQWFAPQIEYTIKSSHELTAVNRECYESLEDLLLPEYFAEIEDEYVVQREWRHDLEDEMREITLGDILGLNNNRLGLEIHKQEPEVLEQKELGLDGVDDTEVGALLNAVKTLEKSPDEHLISTGYIT